MALDTVTAWVAAIVPMLAVIVAAPGATPWTTPAATVAVSASLDDDHPTCAVTSAWVASVNVPRAVSGWSSP